MGNDTRSPAHRSLRVYLHLTPSLWTMTARSEARRARRCSAPTTRGCSAIARAHAGWDRMRRRQSPSSCLAGDRASRHARLARSLGRRQVEQDDRLHQLIAGLSWRARGPSSVRRRPTPYSNRGVPWLAPSRTQASAPRSASHSPVRPHGCVKHGMVTFAECTRAPRPQLSSGSSQDPQEEGRRMRNG